MLADAFQRWSSFINRAEDFRACLRASLMLKDSLYLLRRSFKIV